MAIILLIAFIATPIVEIAVFIEVGGKIGLWPTLAIVVATAIAGTSLLRHQGLATLQRAQISLARQEFPMQEVFDGLCLLLAGALLLTPGFVTDAVGLILFVPPLRRALQRVIHRWMMRSGNVTMFVDGNEAPGQSREETRQGTVIEGKWEEVRPDRHGGPKPPRDDT